MDSNTVRQKHSEFLFPCVANYYQEPIVITEGHGSQVRDADGREYLDFFGGILTLGLGYAHPEVVKRVQDQVAGLSKLVDEQGWELRGKLGGECVDPVGPVAAGEAVVV